MNFFDTVLHVTTDTRESSLTAVQTELARLGVPKAESLYPASLYLKFLHPDHQNPIIGTDFIPSALLTDRERSAQMGAVDYASQVAGKRKYTQTAKNTAVAITDMDAGLGTSLGRDQYIASISHLNGRGLGSKGTDTHFHTLALSRPVSIMEAKAHQYYYTASSFRSTTLEPLLNFESESAYRQFLSLEVPTLRRTQRAPLTYNGFLNNHARRISLANPLMQPNLPTIDRLTGQLTTDRTAPGGHGYLATLLLERLASHPPQPDAQQVRVITNGDGINNTASKEMIGFATEENAGIVIVTTTRTTADVKGGILGLRQGPDGKQYVDIMELAQAGDTQKDLFQALGLTTTDQISALGREHHLGQQYFNTNMVLLNEGLLGQFLSQLRSTIGEEEFARITTPDLIQNPKRDGGKEYIQIEGALGSVLLKLNQYVTTNDYARKLWADISGNSQFLRIINLDQEKRSEFFTPIKTSWDAYLQIASDRFRLDAAIWQLIDNRPGESIKVDFKPAAYKELHTVLAAFADTSVIDLDEFTITGQHVVSVAGMKLKGKVVIHNNFAGTKDLSTILHTLPLEDGKPVLNNVEITIGEHGEIEVKYL